MLSSCASLDSGEVPALGSELDWGIGTDAKAPCLAVINDSRDELMASSSDGVFSILARYVLGEGGVVYGHAFIEGLHVKCVRADSIEGLDCLRGSKYVQSDMGDAMRGVRDDLRSGAPVLFSGTPCQSMVCSSFSMGAMTISSRLISCAMVFPAGSSSRIASMLSLLDVISLNSVFETSARAGAVVVGSFFITKK